MSEMIERVARAMIQESFDPMAEDEAIVYARAAISAMRVPTEKMIVKGGSEHTGYYDLGNADLLASENAMEIFTAMIEEALADE